MYRPEAISPPPLGAGIRSQIEAMGAIDRIGAPGRVDQAVGQALGQLVIPVWSTLRVQVVWNNTGGGGSRDLGAFFGKGTGPADFVEQFYNRVFDVPCAAGQSGIMTDIDLVSVNPVNVGIWDGLVIVGSWDPITSVFEVDDFRLVPNVIEVVSPVTGQITSVSFTLV